MGNTIMEVSATMNWREIGQALAYGRTHLSPERYEKVLKVFKKLICRILLWILVPFAILIGLVAACIPLEEQLCEERLQAYGATWEQIGIRKNETTVQYTKNVTYQFDTESLGINLEEDFPGQRQFTLYLDDEGELKGIASKDEFMKEKSIKIYVGVIGGVLWILCLVLYAIVLRKRSPVGKVWYSYMRWVDTKDEQFLAPLDRL